MGDHFVWKESFNIGVNEIDEQHKLFLDYVNECYNAACFDSQSQVTGATIHDLKAYAATHFRFEENLMKEKGYPDLDKHIKEHLFFEAQVAEIERVRSEGGKRTVDSVLQFLKGWFLRHILEHDKKLAAFLKPLKRVRR